MLSNVKFNPYYNTYENDIVNEFYNKALSEAVKYKRVSAYFFCKIFILLQQRNIQFDK